MAAGVEVAWSSRILKILLGLGDWKICRFFSYKAIRTHFGVIRMIMAQGTLDRGRAPRVGEWRRRLEGLPGDVQKTLNPKP